MIRVGVGGWDFAPWRETFFPPDLPKARALEWASRRLTMIEVNATFYRTQTPETFRRWHAATPDDFVFALKAPRGASFRREPDEAAPSVTHFLESGIVELGPKLGPILWQLPPTRQFDADAIARFLALLPPAQDGIALRHVIEAQHASFSDPAFAALLRAAGVARVFVDSDKHAALDELTAAFVYMRLERNDATQPEGYAAAALDRWAERLRTWSAAEHDCFALCISGDKAVAPIAAQALLKRLGLSPRNSELVDT